MVDAYPGAAEYLPDERSLPALRESARTCRGCDLWVNATQTVFGTGPVRARLMLVGEQPGDVEDRTGQPFVGPAGGLLDRALEEAGIPREDAYVTNVVKHFKWVAKGKRRIHSKPDPGEVRACRPWLDAEIEAVEPAVLMSLGATAGQALFGDSFRVTRQRGVPLDSPLAPLVLASIHPSSIIRIREAPGRDEAFAAFVDDLHVAADYLAEDVPRRATG